MEKTWRISDSEWLIMRCLWKKSPLGTGDILDMLRDTGWSGNMVRALVVRLLDKGAIGAETGSRYYRYYPIASEEECVRQETESFIDRVFEGSAVKLFAAFAGSGRISEKDWLEIKAMIREQEEKK